MEGPAESVSSGRMETLLRLIGGGFEGLLGGGDGDDDGDYGDYAGGYAGDCMR